MAALLCDQVFFGYRTNAIDVLPKIYKQKKKKKKKSLYTSFLLFSCFILIVYTTIDNLNICFQHLIHYNLNITE